MATAKSCHLQDIICSLKDVKDVLELPGKDLSAVCKSLGVPLKGNKDLRVTGVCEKLSLRTTNENKENMSLNSWIAEARNSAKNNHGWTKDIRKMPTISLSDITSYLLESPRHENKNFEIFGKERLLRYKTLRSYRLWKEDHISSLQYHDFKPSIALVRCLSLASFEKQGTEYKTFVAISKETRKILYGHCHCVAGLGEACTHVAGLLFAIEEFVSEGLTELPDDLTCTEKLCKWIVPKGPKDGPQLVRDIPFSKIYPGKTADPINEPIKDPRATDDRSINKDSALLLYHNLHEADNSDAPIIRILESYFDNSSCIHPHTTVLSLPQLSNSAVIPYHDPSLVPSLEKEVKTEYLPLTVKERVHRTLNDYPSADTEEIMKLLAVDHSFIDDVDSLTLGQSQSSYWKTYRYNTCTASNTLAISTRINSLLQSKCSDGGAVLSQILGTSTFSGTAATRYGSKYEATARSDYNNLMSKQHFNFKCSERGFIYHPCGYVGASPDGICSCDCHREKYLIEIKCPSSLEEKDPKMHVQDIDFLSDSGNNLVLKHSHKYYSQVITMMGVTNTELCHLIVWSPKGMLIVQVRQDNSKFQEILAKCKMYFQRFILPSLMQ